MLSYILQATKPKIVPIVPELCYFNYFADKIDWFLILMTGSAKTLDVGIFYAPSQKQL